MITLADVFEEFEDLGYHANKQGINLNVAKCFTYYRDFHEMIFGIISTEQPHYDAHMSNRNRYIIDNTWDLLEYKVRSGKIQDSTIFTVGGYCNDDEREFIRANKSDSKKD